jgi:hypothetical protein
MELAALPKFRINQVVRYMGAKADIVGCHWDGEQWRYELYIRRGKNRGYWMAVESGVEEG